MQEQWTVIYGNAFAFGCSKRIGLRAETELPNESVEQFVVVPFLTDRAGPHHIGKRLVNTRVTSCLLYTSPSPRDRG